MKLRVIWEDEAATAEESQRSRSSVAKMCQERGMN